MLLRDAPRPNRPSHEIEEGPYPCGLRAPCPEAPVASERARPRHRRLRALLIALACGLAPAAEARLTRAEMASVAVAPPPGARVPPDLVFTEAREERPIGLGAALGGRPALLLPVDYTCGNVCDPMVSLSAAALRATGLRPGIDISLILVGLDPRDGPPAARALLDRDGAGAALGEGVRALVGDQATIERLTGALGYGFIRDPGADAIAHPAASLLLAPDGRLARVLSPLAMNGRDLRLAIVEAGEGRVGTLADRFTLLCYGFDAATGLYTPLVRRLLVAAALATFVAIAGGILILSRMRRRRGA